MTETQPTREDKIAKIYDVIARKDLTFGCEIECVGCSKEIVGNNPRLLNEYGLTRSNMAPTAYGYFGIINSPEIKNIIGHKVMIGDVLDWVKENTPYSALKFTASNIFMNRGTTRKPIDDQEEYCIEYVYNLCK